MREDLGCDAYGSALSDELGQEDISHRYGSLARSGSSLTAQTECHKQPSQGLRGLGRFHLPRNQTFFLLYTAEPEPHC